jgi:hypothetical protein
MESLEPRQLLAAAGLVPVGPAPAGALTGKIVYASGGHGWQWNNSLGRWATDRPNVNSMVEDFGNQDQLTLFADYALRAGATVVPMRPVGRQVNEVVVDNDSLGVTWSGAWTNTSTGTRWYDEDYGAGGADAVRYRFASASSGGETAVATYTPNIPESGNYPVYAWASYGSNRTNQLYKINHSGGQAQIRVDHRMVGNGWVYLGTYHFDAGSSAAAGSVQISNQSTAGGVVIADAIRFGNGMGDVPWGSGGIGTGSISGYPREDEGSLLWAWRGLGQGVTPSSVLTTNPSAPPRMAAHMTPSSNPFGSSVFLDIHSNAFNGSARGTEGVIHSTASSRTPNQQPLSTYLSRNVGNDMIARNGQFEYNWVFRRDFGTGNHAQLNKAYTDGKFDSTLIEIGFHDNVMDAAIMRDPRGRDQFARGIYEGVLEYFINYGNVAAPNVTLPSAPINVGAVSNAAGQVTIAWGAGPISNTGVSGVYGDIPAGYRIYASTDGYGFDGGTYAAGYGTNSITLSGYDPTIPYYFKVVAENAGGQSLGSEVVTVLPNGGPKQVLIVNGFDRYDRTQNYRQSYAYGGTYAERVWPRYNNSFDYVVQTHSAVHAARPGVSVASTSNERVISGAVNLNDYDVVVWILGRESTSSSSFDAIERNKVEQFVAGGGHVFVTGAEIAWDLDQQNNGRDFYNNTLKAGFVNDDADTYNVSTAAGGIFAGLSNFSFSDGAAFSNLDSQTYHVNAADVIAPQAGAQYALNYVGGAGGAGIQATGVGGRGNIVLLGFPFETIVSPAMRTLVMDRVLGFFSVSAFVPEDADFNDDDLVDGTDFLVWQRHMGVSVPPLTNGDADGNGSVNGADLTVWRDQFGSVSTAVAATTFVLQEPAQQAFAVEISVDASVGSYYAMAQEAAKPQGDAFATSARTGSPAGLVERSYRPAVDRNYLSDLAVIDFDRSRLRRVEPLVEQAEVSRASHIDGAFDDAGSWRKDVAGRLQK